jgi:ABC-2 type transport system permease protein
MGKIWVVLKREYLERVRTKAFLLSTFLGPILLLALMIVPAWIAERSMRDVRLDRMQVLDATNAGLGTEIQGRLLGASADSGIVSVRVVAPGDLVAAESAATQAVMNKEFAGFLVVDSGTLAGRTARYAGRNASSIGEMEALEAAVRQAVLGRQLAAEGIDIARVNELTRTRVRLQTERISDSGRGGSGTGSVILGFIIAMLLYTSLAIYGQNMLRSVIEEKTTRVAEVIVSSVRTDVLLSGAGTTGRCGRRAARAASPPAAAPAPRRWPARAPPASPRSRAARWPPPRSAHPTRARPPHRAGARRRRAR